MQLSKTFSFEPLPPIPVDKDHGPTTLGPLEVLSLPGFWFGKGFNTIWRPFNPVSQSDHFLELNLTSEVLTFKAINGLIPNRGLLQADITMSGITYLQQISDANLNAGLHIEPGIWISVPQTTNPAEQPTVVRMASIPHGTTILAQGTASTIAGPPTIPNNNITPFQIGDPTAIVIFPEATLSTPSIFRSSGQQLKGITQAMLVNPNSILQDAIIGQNITSTTILEVSSAPNLPLTGGGCDNTSFLEGSQPTGISANAETVLVTATFWIELIEGAFHQLQYSQTVLLNFNGLSWPHVTVATLTFDESGAHTTPISPGSGEQQQATG